MVVARIEIRLAVTAIKNTIFLTIYLSFARAYNS